MAATAAVVSGSFRLATTTAALGSMVVPVILLGSTATTSTATLPAAAATFRRSNLPDNDDLKAYFLECQLIAGTAQKSHRPLGGLVNGAEFDPDLLFSEMGKVVLQLPVQDERHIRVELFLQLPELAVAEVPGARLEHGEHEHVVARVMGKGIKHPRPLDSRAGRGWIRAGQIFPEGNHT